MFYQHTLFPFDESVSEIQDINLKQNNKLVQINPKICAPFLNLSLGIIVLFPIGLRADRPQGIFAIPLDAKCCHWQASITGPVGSPYEGGIFYLYLQVPFRSVLILSCVMSLI